MITLLRIRKAVPRLVFGIRGPAGNLLALAEVAGLDKIVAVIGPAGPSAYNIAVKHGFVGTEAEWLTSLSADNALTWTRLVIERDTDPVELGRSADGDVIEYRLGGVTRYRFIPDDDDPKKDAFYATFADGVLSGLIVSRGS